MNPSASTASSRPRGSAGTKRKAASGGGGKPAVTGSSGKRPKKSGGGGGIDTVKTAKSETVNKAKGSKAGKAGAKKTSPAKAITMNMMADGAGKTSGARKHTKHRKTPAASIKDGSDGENVASGKEAAGRGKGSSPKPKGKAKANKKSVSSNDGGSAVGTKNNQGGKQAGKCTTSSSGSSQLNSGGGSIKKESGDINSRHDIPSSGTANGHLKKKNTIGGGSGGSGNGTMTKSTTKTTKKKDKEKKKTKPKTVLSVKPVVIAPPVVVQKEVPDHHVISNRRAAVLARTFAKETKEAQKDFEEAVAAAERSRVVREQRLKASSSPRGLRHSRPSHSAASAGAVKPTDGASPIPVVSATSGTPGVPKGGTRWPDFGFGGQSWGLGPFYRQEQSEVELGECSGGGAVPTAKESTPAATATMVSSVPARPRRAPKEMRRARVGAGEALNLGEEATFREWLARLRAVQVCHGKQREQHASGDYGFCHCGIEKCLQRFNV